MLELWKPLLVLKDKNNPVIFDELGFKYSEPKWDRKVNTFTKKTYDNHPFVIFYDDKEDCYYYLKARSALKKDLKTYKKKFKKEILIQETAEEGLFKNESYVDCS